MLSIFGNSLGVVATVVVIAYSTPIFLVVIVPMGILYYFIQVPIPSSLSLYYSISIVV